MDLHFAKKSFTAVNILLRDMLRNNKDSAFFQNINSIVQAHNQTVMRAEKEFDSAMEKLPTSNKHSRLNDIVKHNPLVIARAIVGPIFGMLSIAEI